MQVSYWDERFAREIAKAVRERRVELLNQLSAGVPYEDYRQQIGHINGLDEAIQIVAAVLEKLGPENE